MAASFKIEDVDLGWKAAKRNLAGLDGMRVSAGLFDPENATKGALNEFGTSKMPARPSLSIAADTNMLIFAEEAKDDVGEVADRKATPKQALTPLGRLMAKAARAVIETRQVGGPALAQSTIDRKGHDQKLKDSGDMLKAIDFEVEKDTGEE